MAGRVSQPCTARQVRGMILWLVCGALLIGHVPAVAQEPEPGSAATPDRTDRVSELIEALDDEDGGVRRRAAEGLGQIGAADERVVPALIKALDHEDEWVRRRAVDGLGQIGAADERVVPALSKALDHEDAWVRNDLILETEPKP